MQVPEQEKHNRMGRKDKIWGAVALLILALGLVIFCNLFMQVPKSEWRDESTPLSWKGSGVEIKNAEAAWKAAAGDARMELRAYCYPICRIELEEATGEGTVIIRFLNDKGVQLGDRVYIAYKDGQFIPRQSNSMLITAKEATVRLEDGFLTKDEYILHQLDQQAPLWRVEVACRPENGKQIKLGHLSILPHDL